MSRLGKENKVSMQYMLFSSDGRIIAEALRIIEN